MMSKLASALAVIVVAAVVGLIGYSVHSWAAAVDKQNRDPVLGCRRMCVNGIESFRYDDHGAPQCTCKVVAP